MRLVLRGFVFTVCSIGLVAGIPLRSAAQVMQLPPVAASMSGFGSED
jgi:hypothetical protein